MKKAIEIARKGTMCTLSNYMCGYLRQNLVFFNLEDMKRGCSFVSENCIEAGCESAGKACLKATECKTEEEFISACAAACEKCHEALKTKKRINTKKVRTEIPNVGYI